MNIGNPEGQTRYPDCPICKKLCHGCEVCGNIFCCSTCFPCHEENK